MCAYEAQRKVRIRTGSKLGKAECFVSSEYGTVKPQHLLEMNSVGSISDTAVEADNMSANPVVIYHTLHPCKLPPELSDFVTHLWCFLPLAGCPAAVRLKGAASNIKKIFCSVACLFVFGSGVWTVSPQLMAQAAENHKVFREWYLKILEEFGDRMQADADMSELPFESESVPSTLLFDFELCSLSGMNCPGRYVRKSFPLA